MRWRLPLVRPRWLRMPTWPGTPRWPCPVARWRDCQSGLWSSASIMTSRPCWMLPILTKVSGIKNEKWLIMMIQKTILTHSDWFIDIKNEKVAKKNDAREDDYDTHRLIYTYYFIDVSIMISLTAIIQGSSRLFILHGEYQTLLSVFIYTRISLIANSWGQHGAHLGLVGPRWAPCWSHEFCH